MCIDVQGAGALKVFFQTIVPGGGCGPRRRHYHPDLEDPGTVYGDDHEKIHFLIY